MHLQPCPSCRRHVESSERATKPDAGMAAVDPIDAGEPHFAKPPPDAAGVARRTSPDARPRDPMDDEIDRRNINRNHKCVNGQCMPYGAPPVRRRIV